MSLHPFPGVLGMAWLLFAFISLLQTSPTPEENATRLEASGQAALVAKDVPKAREQFEELLKKFPNSPKVNAARLGLAKAWVYCSMPDFAKALELLTPASNDGNFAGRVEALNLQGNIRRLQGQTAKEPATSQTRFQEALQSFATARDLQQQKNLPESARSQCDRAEMELRLSRWQEARQTTEPFLKDEKLSTSPSRKRGLYYHGLACLYLRDFKNAERALNLGSPYDHQPFGLHAEYTLGRILQQNGETADAVTHYDAVLARFKKARDVGQADDNNPFEKYRWEQAKNNPPEAVVGAKLALASLDAEAGRTAQALSRLQDFLTDFPQANSLNEAKLLIGFCQVEERQFAEAEKTLTGLQSTAPKLVDQVLHQLARAQWGQAQAQPSGSRDTGMKAAISTFKLASEKLVNNPNDEKETRLRKWKIAFDLGEAYQQNNQFKEAAETFESLWNEQAQPKKRDEILLRLCLAHGNAGQFDRSQQRIEEFQRMFPASAFLGLVQLRDAENYLGRALEADKEKNRHNEARNRFEETINRYRDVAEKFADSRAALVARYGVGFCALKMERYEEAERALASIPPGERKNELVLTNLLLARAMMSQAKKDQPAGIAPEKCAAQFQKAAEAFGAYLASQPASSEVPDVQLGQAICRVQQALLVTDPTLQKALRSQANNSFAKLIADHPNTLAAGQAMIERTKLLVAEGQADKALAELRQFLPAGSQASQVVAPLGLIQLALVLRERHESQDAVRILQEGIKRWDAPLNADLEKQEWLWLLKYHTGLALDETGQHSLARAQFDDVANRAVNRPLALEAHLQFGKSKVAEGQGMMKLGAIGLSLAGADNVRRNAAQQKIDQGRNLIADAANQFHQRGDQFQNRFAKHEGRARLYYESGWAWRSLTAEETRRTRENMRYGAVQKRFQELLKQATKPDEKVNNSLPKTVPIQPSENSAKYAFGRLAAQFPDTRLTICAQLEQAEYLAAKGDHEAVVKLLETTIDREPTDGRLPESTRDGLRMRLANSLFACGNYPEAIKVYQTLGADSGSSLSGLAKYAAADCFTKLDQPTKAIAELLPFHDQPDWAAKSGIADIGLLRLGQLYIATKQHDAGVKCLQKVTGVWQPEATYAIGCSEAAMNQADKATATFQKLLTTAGHGLNGRVLCQLGRLQLVERNYDLASSSFLAAAAISPASSDIQHLAQLEAARAMSESGDLTTGKILLQAIIAQSPESRWASAAQLRLEKLR